MRTQPTKTIILQSRVNKNKIFCIFLNHNYVCLTKIFYLCTEFEKRHKINKKF